MAWKEASWVNVPSVSVSRQGSVMPFLVCSLFTTFAVRRNCLICSLVRAGSSDACTEREKVRHTIAARISRRHRRLSMFIEVPPLNCAHLPRWVCFVLTPCNAQTGAARVSGTRPAKLKTFHLCRLAVDKFLIRRPLYRRTRSGWCRGWTGQQLMLTQPLTPTIRLVNFGPGLTHSIRVPPRRVDFIPFLLPG